ncbi:MAG: hypothetical protein IT221_02025 [Fluviicola sp.]|nr:hypothetical protein [Fluviicola sp.]
MKYAAFLVLVLSLGLSACKKYKLNQPAYLNFSWNFFNNTQANNKVVIESGQFYIDQLSIDGKRVEGQDVEIDQNLPYTQTSFYASGSLGLSLDIPVGEYTDFQVSLNVNNTVTPCLLLKGSYNNGTDVIPVVIQWSSSKLLDFKSMNGFTLKKKKDYKITLGTDISKLFSTISSNQWELADISNESGTPTIVVKDSYNSGIYQEIDELLASSLVLTVE